MLMTMGQPSRRGVKARQGPPGAGRRPRRGGAAPADADDEGPAVAAVDEALDAALVADRAADPTHMHRSAEARSGGRAVGQQIEMEADLAAERMHRFGPPRILRKLAGVVS